MLYLPEGTGLACRNCKKQPDLFIIAHLKGVVVREPSVEKLVLRNASGEMKIS